MEGGNKGGDGKGNEEDDGGKGPCAASSLLLLLSFPFPLPRLLGLAALLGDFGRCSQPRQPSDQEDQDSDFRWEWKVESQTSSHQPPQLGQNSAFAFTMRRQVLQRHASEEDAISRRRR